MPHDPLRSVRWSAIALYSWIGGAAAAELPGVADPAAPTAPLDYQSVFSNYSRPKLGPVMDWKKANDVVREVGGFAGALKDDPSPPAASTSPAEGRAAPAGSGGHGGHK